MQGNSVTEPILQARGISKQFASFTAVDDVNLEVRSGEIHALIGPNGAGKTTCFNLLTGTLPVSKGSILLRGKEITGMSSDAVARRGLVRSFQISSIFPDFTVLNNVRFALQRKRGANLDFWRSENTLNRLNERAQGLLEELGLAEYAQMRAAELPYGRKRALEIATTLALDPEVLLLDEPTSGMGREDIGRVVDIIRKIRTGRTVLMVEHNLSVVEGLCDHVTVLARGKVIAEGTYDEVAKDEQVITAYLGTPHA
ncbi:MAG: ABC transporter ATP-binding protein [Rhodobiaceae bacterium]|nr:ABC transporter ATP-binding protein [Rhodobiaceae bacterium]MCC0054585.1 ABC transporter ATP-binding protein [Rhodobiaceae bacterium]